MNLLKMYEELQTPEELFQFMQDYIRYGIHVNGITYTDSRTKEFQENFLKYWHLSSPRDLLVNRHGQCWDQVELERDWFTKNGYEFKTLFIWFLFDYENNYTTHTYLVYKDKEDGTWNYFENADFNNNGIHKFPEFREAVNFQKEKHIEFNKNCGNKIDDEIISHLHIYEYDKPVYGINFENFIDHILESKDITSEFN